jgi:hypothetical protein
MSRRQEIVDTIRDVATRVGASVTIEPHGKHPHAVLHFQGRCFSTTKPGDGSEKLRLRPNDNQPSTGPVHGPTRDAAAVSARSARLADEAANFHNDISEV